MAKIIIDSDGVEFEVPDSVAESNTKLLKMLVPFYPALANAKITRKDGRNDKTTGLPIINGQLIVTVTKQAGDKGSGASDVLNELWDASEEINTAVALAHVIMRAEEDGTMTIGRLLRLQPEIHQAVKEGASQIKDNMNTLAQLREAFPIAGKSIPVGF